MLSTRNVSIKDKVEAFLTEQGIKQGSSIVIAYSGGPDSTALLYILNELKENQKYILSCAYLNHGIRDKKEIDREISFIKKTAAFLKIPFFIKNIPHGKIKDKASQKKYSIENVARQERYCFLEKIAKEKKIDYIALGHNYNDQMETIIMRIFQGASLFGLTGIPRKRGNIIRPLLDCNRDEIMDFLHKGHLEYRIDSTNSCLDYLRNKIRIRLMPILQEIFPGMNKGLKRFIQKMVMTKLFIKEKIPEMLSWKKITGGFKIKANIFLKSARIIRLFSFYEQYNKLIKKRKNNRRKILTYSFVAPLLNNNFVKAHKIVLRGCGIKFEWRGDSLFLVRDIVANKKKDYFIVVTEHKSCRIKGLKGEIIFEYTKVNSDITCEVAICESNIKKPLAIRSRHSGDKLYLEFGHKKLKKLFNEWKVPCNLRERIPVLEDANGILAVIGRPFGFKNIFRKGIEIKDSFTKNELYFIIRQVG